MTTHETIHQASERPRFDAPPERRGSIGLVLLVAVVLIACAVGLMVVGRNHAEPYVLGLLALLGMIGVFALFAVAAGILRIAGRGEVNPLIAKVMDGALDGIVVTGPNGRVMFANAAYLGLTGASGAADVRPIERVFVGDPDVSEAVYRLMKAARDGRRLQEEVRVIGLLDKPARWLRLRVRPLDEDDGARRITVWTVADVSRERERQENVFQELQSAIDYLDHAPAGFFSVDATGNVAYLNATLADWLDQDLAQVGSGGLKLSDMVPRDAIALLTAVTGVPGDVKTETLDIDFKTRGGRTLPVRLHHKVAFAADGAAGPSRTLVLNRAVNESPDFQRDAEVRFMRFFHNTPMAIATVDRTGRIARSNALFLRLFEGALKATAKDNATADGAPSVARSLLSAVVEHDRAGLEAAIVKAASGQSEVAPIDAALAPAHGEHWARFYVAPVEMQDRDQEAAIVYVLDLTRERQLQAERDQSEKMKTVGQLAGGMAHDFNNVLSAIMMATDFLLMAHRPTDPSFSDIQQIKQNANRAAALVRGLLAFSRRQTLRPQVLDLNDVLSDLRMLLQRVIGEKVTLDFAHGGDLWAVHVDHAQIEQAIVNLAVNARDAMMPGGGRLTLRTRNVTDEESREMKFGGAASGGLALRGMVPGDYVAIEVSDTGTGIPPEIIEKIFEPFFTTKEINKGTGLGLSTVYGFIKQSGGFVYPDSEMGKGTTFRIFLPRHIPVAEPVVAPGDAASKSSRAAEPFAEAAAAAGEVKKLAADHTGQGVVLLVEDEDGLRGLNARGLSSRGYTVLEAANGLDALDVFDSHEGKIDIVVSDVMMPEMDGPTLLRELRRRDPDLKIVFVSGYAEEAFGKNLDENSKFDFLAKPFTLKQLVSKVKDVASA